MQEGSRRSDARLARTRAALTEALVALLEERPFDQITIREITARGGVGYASFFRHYASKDALLHDLAADQIATLIGLSQPAFAATDTRAAARALCEYVDAHRRLWSALLTGGAAGVVREEFVRQASLLRPERSGRTRWLPAELAVICGVSGTVEILAWWLSRRDSYPPDQVAEIVDRLVIAPFVEG